MSNSSRPLRPGDPRAVDGYRVLGRLGRGAMGTVYLAESGTGCSPARRRRLLVAGSAGAAVLVLVAALGLLLIDRDGPPSDTAPIYEYDFEDNPDWTDLGLYHPENSNESGYWAVESGIMLVRDPEVHDGRGATAWAPPLQNAVPERLMARTEVRAVSGYGQARYGLVCWERYGPQDDPVHTGSYQVLVNLDGERAAIQRWSAETESWEDVADGAAARGHRAFPALQGENDPEVTNDLAFACEYVEDQEDGSPGMEVSAWVNGRLVVHAVDDGLPAEAADADAVRRFGLVMDAGPIGQNVGVLFESLTVEELLTG